MSFAENMCNAFGHIPLEFSRHVNLFFLSQGDFFTSRRGVHHLSGRFYSESRNAKKHAKFTHFAVTSTLNPLNYFICKKKKKRNLWYKKKHISNNQFSLLYGWLCYIYYSLTIIWQYGYCRTMQKEKMSVACPGTKYKLHIVFVA